MVVKGGFGIAKQAPEVHCCQDQGESDTCRCHLRSHLIRIRSIVIAEPWQLVADQARLARSAAETAPEQKLHSRVRESLQSYDWNGHGGALGCLERGGNVWEIAGNPTGSYSRNHGISSPRSIRQTNSYTAITLQRTIFSPVSSSTVSQVHRKWVRYLQRE